MRLDEKTIKFTTKEGDSPNFEQTKNLKLVVNGKTTEVGIEEIFFNVPSINSGYIKGYSVLEKLEETSPKVFDLLKIGEGIDPLTVGFVDLESGTLFHIKSIDIPALYYDTEIPDEDIATHLKKFYSPSVSTDTTSTDTTKEVVVDTEEVMINKEVSPSEESPKGEDAKSPPSPQGDKAEASEGDSSPTLLDGLTDEMTEAGYTHQHIEGFEVFAKLKRVPSVFKVDESGELEEVTIEETGFYVSEDGLTVAKDKPEASAPEVSEKEEVEEEEKTEEKIEENPEKIAGGTVAANGQGVTGNDDTETSESPKESAPEGSDREVVSEEEKSV